MYLRGYRDRPGQFAPNPGEILYARRSPHDKWTLAAVEKAWCNRAGLVRIRVVWFEDDPDASPGEKDRNDRDGVGESQRTSRYMQKVETGWNGWITLRDPLDESPLIKQVDREELPRKVIEEYDSPIHPLVRLSEPGTAPSYGGS